MTTAAPTVVNEERDSRGLLTKREWSDGTWKKWEYNDLGLKTFVEEPKGVWTRYIYNDQGLRIMRRGHDGNDQMWLYDRGALVRTCKCDLRLD